MYEVKRIKKGCYEVVNKDTGDVRAKCTTLKKANAQIRLLYGIESGKWLPKKKGGIVTDFRPIGRNEKLDREEESGMGCGGDIPIEDELGAGVDKSITLNCELMVRLLEWAREEVKADVPLHVAVENMSKKGSPLTMKDYDDIIKQHKITGGKIKINTNNKNMSSWKQFWAGKCKGKKFGSRDAVNKAMRDASIEWKKKKGGALDEEEGAGAEPLLLSPGLGASQTNFSVLPSVKESICAKSKVVKATGRKRRGKTGEIDRP